MKAFVKRLLDIAASTNELIRELKKNLVLLVENKMWREGVIYVVWSKIYRVAVFGAGIATSLCVCSNLLSLAKALHIS